MLFNGYGMKQKLQSSFFELCRVGDGKYTLTVQKYVDNSWSVKFNINNKYANKNERFTYSTIQIMPRKQVTTKSGYKTHIDRHFVQRNGKRYTTVWGKTKAINEAKKLWLQYLTQIKTEQKQ